MKAVRIHRYGGPEELRWENAPDPEPGPGELLVRVAAAGVNPADYKFRAGWYENHFALPMPLILGMDVAGHVEGLGEGVTGFVPGDAVLAMIPHTHKGGYATKVAAPAAWFAPLPEGLDPGYAAALPTPGSTGWQLVTKDLKAERGSRVLVTGATGGVGRAACYAAKQSGAHVTAAVRERHVGEVMWADDIVVLDAETDSGGATYDSIADTIGGEVANRLLGLLRPGGTLSSVSTTPVGDTKGLDVIARRFSVTPEPAGLALLAAAMADGLLLMPPVSFLPMSQAAEAHSRIEAGGAGKFVLVPDP